MQSNIDLLTGIANNRPCILSKTQRHALLELLFYAEVQLLNSKEDPDEPPTQSRSSPAP
jgi:hypothetical protein